MRHPIMSVGATAAVGQPWPQDRDVSVLESIFTPDISAPPASLISVLLYRPLSPSVCCLASPVESSAAALAVFVTAVATPPDLQMAGINADLGQARSDDRRPYIYAPLQHDDSIRLLTLFPGDMKSPIQISLAEVRSKDNHSYEALSYTWAREDDDFRRLSQIRSDGGRILVTKNCELALRHLRKSDTSRVLWVDAICINQEDDTEKGHQVDIMRDVYSKATEVLIWLGVESKDTGVPLHFPDSAEAGISDPSSASTMVTAHRSTFNPGLAGRDVNDKDPSKSFETTRPVSEIFLEFLGRMASEIHSLQSAGQDPKSSPLYQELMSQAYTSTTGPVKTDLYRGFKDIMKRRWWTRVWVVQEVVVARSATLVCSKLSTSYNNLFDWYRLLNHDHNLKATILWSELSHALTHLRSVFRARRVYTADENSAKFMEVLRRVRYLNASDPRDSIFGVLGLSKNFKSLLPTSDYSKSPTEVFTEVAKALLNETKSLSILIYATSVTPLPDHPSWVPYWSNPPLMKDTRDKTHRAAGKSEAVFAISSDDKELRVKGQYFDQVKDLPLADLRGYERYPFFHHRVDSLRMSCGVGYSLTKYPTGESVEEALWRTLCWNSDSDHRRPEKEIYEIAFREWHSFLNSNDRMENIKRDIRKKEISFALIVNSTAPLCTTVNGYLAAVPYIAKAGDCIAILAGVDFPFVLRPTEDHYRLVGPCYVHGIMRGEAFPEYPEELEWFWIR